LAQFGCTAALINRGPPPAGTLPGCRVSPRAKFTGVDPRVTLNYTTGGGTLLYAVYAAGRKPGGFNGAAGIIASLQTGQDFTQYVPEKSKGGELGAKFDALGRTLRGSVSLFYNELSDVQLTSAIPNPSGTGAITSIVTNSGDAETKGFEIEAFAAPSRELSIRLGVAYVDAKFTRGCDSDEFILNSGGLRPNFDTRNPPPAALALCSIEGRRLPLGSPWIINGGFSYEREVNDRSGLAFFANSSFSFEDQKFVQVDISQRRQGCLSPRWVRTLERFSPRLFGPPPHLPSPAESSSSCSARWSPGPALRRAQLLPRRHVGQFPGTSARSRRESRGLSQLGKGSALDPRIEGTLQTFVIGREGRPRDWQSGPSSQIRVYGLMSLSRSAPIICLLCTPSRCLVGRCRRAASARYKAG
jgi:hypothetical protein